MSRAMLTAIVICGVCLTGAMTSTTLAEVPQRAQDFWQALSRAEVDSLKKFYAPQVTLFRGSELLKPEWGVVQDDQARMTGALVARDDLLRGYGKLIEKIGADKWKRIFAAADASKLQATKVTQDNAPLKGVKQGDVLLLVAIGAGDDKLGFVFRPAADGELQVVLEATDY